MDLDKYSIERMFLVKKAIDMTNAITPINNMLDMACNNGYWLNTVRRFLPSAQLIGVDTQDFADRGWAEYSKANIEFRSGNSLSFLKSKEKQYDTILCMGMLYYYDDIKDFLKITTNATKSTLLIDTLCYNSNKSQEKRILNPTNAMTKAALEASKYVTIPSESKLMGYLDELGFFTYKIDAYSDKYSDSVGGRLGLDIKRSGILAIRKKNYCGWHKYSRV